MIVVEPYRGKSVMEHRVEIVERKGLGHPDFMCDAIMEAISVALSTYYLREFGTVLHHNIDKGLLAAGRTEKTFGGGRLLEPMELTIGDRATFTAGGREIPVADIALGTAKAWVRDHLRFVDPEEHITYRSVLAAGSEELTDIFLRAGAVRGANDTSAAVGYAPHSPTEEAVLGLERHLNSTEFKQRHPETGEDIKVMGLRTGTDHDFTIAMPLMCRQVESEEEYFGKKETVLKEIREYLAARLPAGRVEVHLNTLDAPGRGLSGVYLSLLGTSAEDADSGQVGRGNRVNGLISMNRPMGTEAAAGKNPVSHVGKIYNILSHRTAERIYREVEGVREVYVLLLSRIGTPVDSPQMASAQVLLERGVRLRDISRTITALLEEDLRQVPALTEQLAAGEYPIC